ncbi:MAG: MFS transporter [Promethearchaeota archaeon]
MEETTLNPEFESQNKSPKKIFTFSFPRLSSSIVLGITGFALMTLYTTGYQLNPAIVAFAISAGYIAIALSQFFIGWLSDAIKSKWGRRKPFIYILTPLEVISFICLLMPGLFLKNPGDNLMIAWLFIWNILFEAFYSMTTPYQAWMAEEFKVEDRPKVSQYQNFFNLLGNGIQAIFSMLILTSFANDVGNDPNNISPTFFWTCIAFGAMFLISFYACAWLMPTEAPPKRKPDMLKNLKEIFQHKNYLLVVLMQGIASLAWATITAVMLSYTDTVLGFGKMEYIISAVFLLLGMFVAIVIWRKIMAKIGKTQTLLYLFLYAAAVSIFSLIGLLEMPSFIRLIFGTLLMAGIASFLGGWYLFPYIMYADLAEDNEKSSDELKAGIYVGFPSIALNIFQAVGTLILGALMGLRNTTVNGLTFSYGYVVWGPFCAIVLIGAYFFTKKFVHLDFDWERKTH